MINHNNDTMKLGEIGGNDNMIDDGLDFDNKIRIDDS